MPHEVCAAQPESGSCVSVILSSEVMAAVFSAVRKGSCGPGLEERRDLLLVQNLRHSSLGRRTSITSGELEDAMLCEVSSQKSISLV